MPFSTYTDIELVESYLPLSSIELALPLLLSSQIPKPRFLSRASFCAPHTELPASLSADSLGSGLGADLAAVPDPGLDPYLVDLVP